MTTVGLGRTEAIPSLSVDTYKERQILIGIWIYLQVVDKMATILQKAALQYLRNSARPVSHAATAGGHGGK